jgi:hypothetical protein
MVTPRTSQEITQQEIQAFAKFCGDHDIVIDGSVGEQNANALGDYIVDLWKVEITDETLEVALGKLRDRIVFYTPAQVKYRKIAAEDIERANQLIAWFQGPGNTSLVRAGDQGFENQTALLVELKGREISSREIQNAIGRLSFKSGLHFVPAPRPVDSRQHVDDGRGFMPKDSVNLTARDHKRLADAATATALGQESVPTTDYQALAENVRGRTHSESERIARLFVTKPGTSEILWPDTYEARRRVSGL